MRKQNLRKVKWDRERNRAYVLRDGVRYWAPQENSAAGIVLNVVENYGQALLSQAESAINRHLGERRRKKETP